MEPRFLGLWEYVVSAKERNLYKKIWEWSEDDEDDGADKEG